MFVVDLRHFLDEKGDIAAMPAPAVTLARFNASIVGWVTLDARQRLYQQLAERIENPGRLAEETGA